MSDVMEKIKNGRQYRNMTIEVKESEAPKEGAFLVRGYCTTYNEPYTLFRTDEYEVKEQVDPHAFDECDMSDVIMQYDHEGRVFARISNDTLALLSDDHGLLIEADLGGTSIGRQLYEEIKGGYTNKMSFGFVVDEDSVDESKEGSRTVYLRTIKKIGKLYDVSAVSLPANDGTEISARAYADGVIAQAEAERLLEAENERKAKVEELKQRINKTLLEVKIDGI